MTRDEFDNLSIQLGKTAGAHAHTLGKAKFYMEKLIDKPNAKFSNCTQEEFLDRVRGAAYRGEWAELSDIMGRWW